MSVTSHICYNAGMNNEQVEGNPEVNDANPEYDAELEAARNQDEVTVDTTPQVEHHAPERPEELNRTNSFDIFAWGNNLSRIKNDLKIELFLVNKHYTVYQLPIASELLPQVAPVFLLGVLNDIEKGAGLGLEVRAYEKSEQEPGVLLYSTRKQVSNANHVLNIIEHERETIEAFDEYNHEFKTIKMVVARFTHKDIEPFYVVKQLAGSGSLNERTAWQIDDNGKLDTFKATTAFKVPTDNQVLICGNAAAEGEDTNQRIFAFSPKKFEAMFGYNFKKQSIADKKVEQILSHYDLNFPDGQDLNTMIAGKTKLINKLQKLDIGTKTQEELVQYAEDMALNLMTTDGGAIIIMDNKDLDTFVSLLNDDFMTSELTGFKYEVKGKKLLEGGDGE